MKVNKKYVVIGIVMIVVASVAAYLLQPSEDESMAQTNVIMSGIPAQCYTYFPTGSNSSLSSNAQVAYYQSMVDGINKTGIKYLGPFLRSPAFAEWLFKNCPVYNSTNSIYTVKQFNESYAENNARIDPSPELLKAVQSEQQMLSYNYIKNPDNFTDVFQMANHFNTDLQTVSDNLFMAGALDINGITTKNGTANGPLLSECHNPSWLKNSIPRQCSIYNSTMDVNVHNQNLMLNPMQSVCKVSSCTINGTLVMPSFIAKMFGR